MTPERREKRKALKNAKKVSIARKLKKIQVNPELLGELFKHLTIIDTNDGKSYSIDSKLPSDARVVGVTVNAMDNLIHLYLTSDSFEPINEGTTVPSLDVVVSELKEDSDGPEAQTVQA